MKLSDETIKAVQQAFHEADEAGCSLEQCWGAALAAIAECGEVREMVDALRVAATAEVYMPEYGVIDADMVQLIQSEATKALRPFEGSV